MRSESFFFIFIPILSLILLLVNFFFATHNPYEEKDSVFECGFHSFLEQTRVPFNISFYIFALFFMLFDVEIFAIFPFVVTAYENNSYGLAIALIFFSILGVGFVYELGKNALTISSRQTQSSKV